MRADHVAALLRVELRRALPAFIRGLAPLGVMLLLLIFARKPASETAAFIGFTSLAVGSCVEGMLVFQDRQRGVLAFLCALPTDGRSLAASRFIACACLTAPCAVLAAGGLHAITGQTGAIHPLAATLGLLVAAWVVACVVGWVAIALLTRYSLSSAVLIPFSVFVAGVTICQLLFPDWVRRASDPARALTLVAPSTAFELGAVLLVASAALAVFAFESTARRFAAPRPEPIVP